MTQELIRDVFSPAFSNAILDKGNDFAGVPLPHSSIGKLVVSTDSHIVKPIIFPVEILAVLLYAALSMM